MSCGEPTLHPELLLDEVSLFHEMELFKLAVSISPTDMVMRNGVVDKTDTAWFTEKIRQNYQALLKAWECRID